MCICFCDFSSAKLASQTSLQSIVHPRYNVFVDTSEQNTIKDVEFYKYKDILYDQQTEASHVDERNFDKLMRYSVEFDGGTGIVAKKKNVESMVIPVTTTDWSKNYKMAEWTLSFWFKFNHENPLPYQNDGAEQLLVQLEVHQGTENILLECTVNRNAMLSCFEDDYQKRLQIDLKAFGVVKNEWFFVAVDSRNSNHRLQIWDKSWSKTKSVKKVSKGPISIGNSAIYLGLRKETKSGGFVGSLRHFTIFKEQFSSARDFKNIAFQYMNPIGNSDLLVELPLDDKDLYSGLFEQVNKFNFEITNGELTQSLDDSPNWSCFYQTDKDFEDLYRFQGSNTQLQNITLQNYRETKGSTKGNYQVTVKMWIYREHLSSTKGEVTIENDGEIDGRKENINKPNSWDEILFHHDNIMTLAFYKNSSEYLTLYNFEDPSNSIQVLIPRGKWVWIQAEHTENYFGMEVRDQNKVVLRSGFDLQKHSDEFKGDISTNPKYVHIAPNFFGYIKGIKYFRNIQIKKDPEYFDDLTSTNRSLIFYFKFDKDSFFKDSTQNGDSGPPQPGGFINRAKSTSFKYNPIIFNSTVYEVSPDDSSQLIIRERDPQMLFDYITFKKTYARLQMGTYESDVTWDGVTCDYPDQDILLMKKGTEMLLNFDSKEPLMAFSLQFWFNLNGGVTWKGRIIEVKGIKSDQLYIGVEVDKGDLECQLYDPKSKGKVIQKVIYKDYTDDQEKKNWVHVTCFFDGIANFKKELDGNWRDTSLNLLQGTLYQDAQSFVYYQDYKRTQKQMKSLQFSESKLAISIKPPTTGDSYFIQDVRLWDKALSKTDQLVFRHQQLKHPAADHYPNLLVYAPLNDGLQYPHRFYNWVSKRQFQSSDLTFAKPVEGEVLPMICPTWTMFTYKEGQCEVHDILRTSRGDAREVGGFLMKGRDDLVFSLAVDDVRFIDRTKSYQRLLSPQFLRHNWELRSSNLHSELRTKLEESMGTQQTGHLRLPLTEADLSKAYDKYFNLKLRLDIEDQSLNAQIEPLENIDLSVKAHPCAAFYEASSGKAYLEKELSFQRGTDYFDFEFSGRGCDDFQFDPNNNDHFKMQLIYNEGKKFPILSYTRRGNKVRVEKAIIGGVLPNEDFFLVAQVTFQSKKNRSIKQDLSLVLKLRWNTEIDFHLPLEVIGVPKLGDLKIDASSAVVINSEIPQDRYNLEWQWICPSDFDCSRTTLTNKQLDISQSTFKRLKNVEYLKTYNFILRIQSGYSQLNGQPFIERKISATWLGAPSKVEYIYDYTNSMAATIDIELNLDNSAWFDQVNLYWSVIGDSTATKAVAKRINPKTDYLNSDDQLKFMLAPQTLNKAGYYYMRLVLYAKNFDNVIVYSKSTKLRVVSGPSKGTLTIDADQGDALTTEFTIKAENWRAYKSTATPDLVYQYFYLSPETQTMVALTDAQMGLTFINTFLPETDQIFVQVSDDLGGQTLKSKTIRVRFNEDQEKGIANLDEDISEIINQLNDTETSGDFQNNPDKLMDIFKKTSLWTSSLKRSNPADLDEGQMRTIPMKLLKVLSLGVKKSSILNDDQKKFISQSTIQQLDQLLNFTGNGTNDIFAIKEGLTSLNELQSELSPQLQSIFKEQAENKEIYLNLVSMIYEGIQTYSFGQNQTSTTNNTLKVQAISMRQQINGLEKVIGLSLVDGRKQVGQIQNMKYSIQKLSKSSEARSDFTYAAQDESVKLIFPLSSAAQPTASQTLTSIIFSNSDSRATPSQYTVGGPFSGKRLLGQKIIGNTTVYLSYRDQQGNYLDRDYAMNTDQLNDRDNGPKVEIDNRLYMTEHLHNVFRRGKHQYLKCAYISTEQFEFSRFEYEQCDTQIIKKDNSKILYDSKVYRLESEKPVNLTEEVINNKTGVKKPVLDVPNIYEAVSDDSFVTLRCLCAHMSYYTVIEDLENRVLEEEEEELLIAGFDVYKFRDWPSLIVVLYVVFILAVGILYARAKDEMDLDIIKQHGEGAEHVPNLENGGASSPAQAAQKKELTKHMTLMSWIFHRKSHIEPFTFEQSTQKNPESVSARILYSVFLRNIHSLFAIFNYYDLSMRRVDRAITLISRIILCVPICYISLNEIDFVQIEERAILISIITALCALLLFPLPTWIFEVCRSKYYLKSRVISEQYDEDTNNLQIEQNGSATDRSMLQKVKIYINPFWSIGELLDVNNVPLEMLEEGERRLRDSLRRRSTVASKRRNTQMNQGPAMEEVNGPPEVFGDLQQRETQQVADQMQDVVEVDQVELEMVPQEQIVSSLQQPIPIDDQVEQPIQSQYNSPNLSRVKRKSLKDSRSSSRVVKQKQSMQMLPKASQPFDRDDDEVVQVEDEVEDLQSNHTVVSRKSNVVASSQVVRHSRRSSANQLPHPEDYEGGSQLQDQQVARNSKGNNRYSNENDDAAYGVDQQQEVTELDSSILPLRSPHLDSPGPPDASSSLGQNRRSRLGLGIYAQDVQSIKTVGTLRSENRRPARESIHQREIQSSGSYRKSSFKYFNKKPVDGGNGQIDDQPMKKVELIQGQPMVYITEENEPRLEDVIVDQYGNVMQILEEDEIEEADDPIGEKSKPPSEEPQEFFVDEEKYLVDEGNMCGRFIGRSGVMLVILIIGLVFTVFYMKGHNFERPEHSYLWVSVFFVSQFLSFFILQPVLLFFHAIFFANNIYDCMVCGGKKTHRNLLTTSIVKMMPRSSALMIDLVEQSLVTKEIIKPDQKNLSEQP